MPVAAPPLDIAELLFQLANVDLPVEERGAVLSGINEEDLDAAVALLQRIKSRARRTAAPSKNDDESDDESSEEGAPSPAAPSTLPLPASAQVRAAEAATLGAWLEARLHSHFTLTADELYGGGMLSREERQALSGAIGTGLDAFVTTLQTSFPDAFSRPPDAGPDAGASASAEEATKTEDGQSFPASDYAYVPDPEKPSTWKLRLTSTPGGAPDARIVGAAAAALGPGFRGQRVQIPAADLPRVKAKVRAAWRRANPDKDADEMPPGIREAEEAEIRPLLADEVPMIEATARALAEAGKAEIVVIKPGWGSSGYYPAAVLQRDGPKAFPAGTHMYWNHPTASERRERPERDVHELAATFAEDSAWRDAGKDGPALYANVDVLNQWTPHLKELAPHIGNSVFGNGKGHMGVAEGRRGFIFDSIIPSPTNSVDFVTHAGAGGKVLSLIEAARAGAPVPGPAGVAPPPAPPTGEEDSMPEPQTPSTPTNPEDPFNDRAVEEVAVLRSQLAAHQRQLLEYAASEITTRVFTEDHLPADSRPRVAERLVPAAFTNADGELDRERFAAAAHEAAMDEMGYLSRVRAASGITGMGASASRSAETTAEMAEAALERELRLAVPHATDAGIEKAVRG